MALGPSILLLADVPAEDGAGQLSHGAWWSPLGEGQVALFLADSDDHDDRDHNGERESGGDYEDDDFDGCHDSSPFRPG